MCLSTVMTSPLGPSCTKGSANTWDHCESGENASLVMEKDESERKNKKGSRVGTTDGAKGIRR